MRTDPPRALAPALAGWTAACALLAASAGAQPAPPPDQLCPAIDEDYQLCSRDLLSGNCAEFVAAAETLAQLYQIQAAESPERGEMLLASNWWGCGSATLIDMKALLGRIGTPRAQALLAAEPFRRLPAAEWQAAPPPSGPPAPAVAPDCVSLPTPAEQAACAERDLAAARAAYRAALAACQAEVAPGLRDQLAQAERAWEAGVGPECEPDALEYSDPMLQAFARSRCLAEAARERTSSMLAAHPECTPPAR